MSGLEKITTPHQLSRLVLDAATEIDIGKNYKNVDRLANFLRSYKVENRVMNLPQKMYIPFLQNGSILFGRECTGYEDLVEKINGFADKLDKVKSTDDKKIKDEMVDYLLIINRLFFGRQIPYRDIPDDHPHVLKWG